MIVQSRGMTYGPAHVPVSARSTSHRPRTLPHTGFLKGGKKRNVTNV
jgi:hypothetical protein